MGETWCEIHKIGGYDSDEGCPACARDCLAAENAALRAEVEAMRPVVEAATELADRYDDTCAALDLTIGMSRGGSLETVDRARHEQDAAMLGAIAAARRYAAAREGKS